MDQGNPNTRDVQRDLLQRTTNVLRTVLSELESPVSAPSPSSASAQSSLPAKRVKQFQVSLSFFRKGNLQSVSIFSNLHHPRHICIYSCLFGFSHFFCNKLSK